MKLKELNNFHFFGIVCVVLWALVAMNEGKMGTWVLLTAGVFLFFEGERRRRAGNVQKK